jgi:salicylate hydroxylase
VSAAVLDDGTRVDADLYVAADGIGSVARGTLFPEARIRPGQVHELVSIVEAPAVAASLGRAFVKFEDPSAGVSFGLVPCTAGRVVWFLQVDAARHPTEGADPGPFARDLVGGWAAPVDEVLDRTDVSRAYWWRTGDMDPLPALAAQNLALLGDAAHPFLPFTSQGVAHALGDAVTLGDCLAATPDDIRGALARYSALRLPEVTATLHQGRRIRDHFLDPTRVDAGATLPLALVPHP